MLNIASIALALTHKSVSCRYIQFFARCPSQGSCLDQAKGVALAATRGFDPPGRPLMTNRRSSLPKGRVITQAVSRRLSTTAARFRTQVRSWGICGGQSGIGPGFFRVLRFPLPILIPPTASHSLSSIIRGWYNRPNSGQRTEWTLVSPNPKKLKKKTKLNTSPNNG
jgi:hypothetical protein